MFIRVKTTKNSPRKSVQIVEGIRDHEGKVKQRIVRHVGIAQDDDELERLKDLAEYVKTKIIAEHAPYFLPPEEVAEMAIEARKKRTDQDKPTPIDDIALLTEEQTSIIGIHEVYGTIYDQLGFSQVIPNPVRTAHMSSYLRHIVLARIANPTSKHKAVEQLSQDFGITLQLHRVYRAMDKIDDRVVERIQKCALGAARSLFKEKIDVLFYDVTTLYFESFTEDELKKNGYSKDMKFNQPQVVLALLVTKHGIPIGYEVFPGNQYEGHTLEVSVNALQKRYDIDNIVFVADSGMLSKDNLDILESKGVKYIVGARLKNQPKQRHEKIQNVEAFEQASGDLKYTTIDLPADQKLIVSYRETRAHKDKKDRDKAIAKLTEKLKKSDKPDSLISNYGYKKYMTIEGEGQIKKNEQKILEDAKWDGLHGIITNITDRPAIELLSHYTGLWQVEESFRITKHDLEARPIFHWSPERVKAHLAICFMALTCVRHLEYRVALQSQKLSPEVIRNALCHVRVSVRTHEKTGMKYGFPSSFSPEARQIYQTLGLKLSSKPFQIP